MLFDIVVNKDLVPLTPRHDGSVSTGYVEVQTVSQSVLEVSTINPFEYYYYEVNTFAKSSVVKKGWFNIENNHNS